MRNYRLVNTLLLVTIVAGIVVLTTVIFALTHKSQPQDGAFVMAVTSAIVYAVGTLATIAHLKHDLDLPGRKKWVDEMYVAAPVTLVRYLVYRLRHSPGNERSY